MVPGNDTGVYEPIEAKTHGFSGGEVDSMATIHATMAADSTLGR